MSRIPDLPGVYCVINEGKRRMYIGRTKSLSRRLAVHLHYLRYNRHKSRQMQADFSAGDRLEFKILEVLSSVDDMRLAFLEQWWINRMSKECELYNQQLRVFTPSPETWYEAMCKIRFYSD